MKQLCHLLLLQGHSLYRSQFGWFDKIGISWVVRHGVSAMNENELLLGKPHGGSVIIWNPNIKAKIDPVEYNSNRACAITIEMLNKKRFLLLCIYMPCDDKRTNTNLIEYVWVLNDIDIICNSVDVHFVCLGGDLNTDLSSGSYQTKELI